MMRKRATPDRVEEGFTSLDIAQLLYENGVEIESDDPEMPCWPSAEILREHFERGELWPVRDRAGSLEYVLCVLYINMDPWKLTRVTKDRTRIFRDPNIDQVTFVIWEVEHNFVSLDGARPFPRNIPWSARAHGFVANTYQSMPKCYCMYGPGPFKVKHCIRHHFKKQ